MMRTGGVDTWIGLSVDAALGRWALRVLCWCPVRIFLGAITLGSAPGSESLRAPHQEDRVAPSRSA